MKYLPYIAIAGLIAFIFLYPTEVVTIDNTHYYEAKIDSIVTLNEAHVRMIENRDKAIEETKKENDSLISYQNRIYVFYENKLKSLDTLTDNEQYELFYLLTDD